MEKVYFRNMELAPDTYYYYCGAGLGDTMVTAAIKTDLEEKFGAKVIFLVKDTHGFIPPMYGIDEFYVIHSKEDMKYVESQAVRFPAPGKIFAAHPVFHKELTKMFQPVRDQVSTEKFLPWYMGFFGVDKSTEMKYPVKYPEMTDKLREKIEKIAPLEKIVMISPEATSMIRMNINFWKEKIKKMKDRGDFVISNVIDKTNTLPGTSYVNLTSLEAVQLGLNCKEVHSVRSGLCDILFSRGKDLYVYYPTHRAYFLYCMNNMFRCTKINEEIVINDQW